MRHPKERLILPRELNRRDFLRLSTGLAGGALLSACGGSGTSQSSGGSSQSGPSSTAGGPIPSAAEDGLAIGSPGNPVQQPLFDDLPAIESGLDPEAGPLRIYNWADYINVDTLKAFRKEFGVDYEVTTFYNLDEALRKLSTGELEADVFFPTSPVLPKYVAGKLLQPLNHDYLPNLEKNVWPELADPYYDSGSRYSVPYAVYQTGLAWRTDQVDLKPEVMDNPWDVFWDPQYKGKVGLYDDNRETISVALFHDGVMDPNTTDQAALQKAGSSLAELVDLVNIRYSIDGAYVKLPEGQVGLHHAWSGDMVNAQYYMPEGGDPSVLRYLWPPKGAQSTSGGLIANDCMAVMANAQKPVLAHMFLNFMLDNAHALNNFGWTGYQPPLTELNPESLVTNEYVPTYLESAIVRQGDFQLGQVPLQLTPEVARMWQQVWASAQTGG
ncbi:MAG: extracellular solute-binding protein [Egibacteraceae bacterium]